jgi:hypothetical protein
VNPHTQPFTQIPPPPIPQLSPTSRPLISDVYDPTISPNRPISPRSHAALFPNQSVIAVNPVTGRPLLPKIPVLPRRLRLTDSDDEDNADEEGADEEEQEVEPHDLGDAEAGFTTEEDEPEPGTSYARARQRPQMSPPAYARPPPPPAVDHDLQAALSSTAETDDEASSDRRERERIARMLAEMMDRQRKRAAATSKGKASTSRRDQEDLDGELAEEKEELMGLIMGSLRREVARLDEEAWMFGESCGNGGELVGRDEVGVYD